MSDEEKLADIYKRIKDLEHKVEVLIQEYESIEAAFPRDTDNSPDFSGHKTYHRKEILKEARTLEAADRVKTNLVTWTIIGIISILGSIIVQVYIEPIIKLAKH